jgi:hypothetical protein
MNKNISSLFIVMYKNILIIILFLGIIFVIIDLVKTEKECPQNKIIYRYIPRTLDEELDSPAYVTDIFNTMFTQPSPWIKGIDNMTLRKREDVNKYFISQF